MAKSTSKNDELVLRLRAYGLPVPASELYVFLLTQGASTRQKILRSRVVAFDEIQPSLFLLSHLFLVAKQQFREKERYYAVDPQIAWKWQEFRQVWDVLKEIVPTGSKPAFKDAKDERRVSIIRDIRERTSDFFERSPFSCVRGGRGRPQFDEGDYAHVCAEAISLASKRFVAVDRPPNDTASLPIFWSAITERRKNGVFYDRVVSIEEAFHHGLDIVERDVNDIGIDIYFADHKLFKNTYYVVDDYCAIIRNEDRSDQIVSRITYDKGKIQRLLRHATQLQGQCVHARQLIDSLRSYAAKRISELPNLTVEERDSISKIISMGKFADLRGASDDLLASLVARKLVAPLDEGFSLNIKSHRGQGLTWLPSYQ